MTNTGLTADSGEPGLGQCCRSSDLIKAPYPDFQALFGYGSPQAANNSAAQKL